MKIIADHLIFIDGKADELIKIHDLKSNTLLKSFGRRGQGPSEFIQAYDIIPCPNDSDAFWISDLSTRKLKRYHLRAVLNDDFAPDKVINLKGATGFPTQLTITPGNEILGVGFFYSNRMEIYNMRGDFIRGIGRIPIVLENDRFASHHAHGFTGQFIFKAPSQEIFLATRHGAIVERYDMKNGKLLTTFMGPDPFFPEYSIVPVTESSVTMAPNKKTRYGYLDICYNQKTDGVFLLYSGGHFFNQKNRKANHGHIVYVLDSRGKIIEELELDKGISLMTMNEDGSALYGRSSEGNILKFEYDKTEMEI